MKVIIQRSNNASGPNAKPKDEILMSEVFKSISPKVQQGFIFIYKVEHQDHYFMMIEIEYTSKYFSEQLVKIFQTHQELDIKQFQSPHYEVDLSRKVVTRKFFKKYKFEALLPFEVRKSISLKNNQFLLQIKVTNTSVNKVFMERVLFNCLHPNIMKAVDLNCKIQQNEDDENISIFQNSIVFNPEEIR
mmetsp:Transcript_17795/g.17022  ORF Transcript_17795/g.17022 Transcript_17795/m.17022 type:complete len:189 (+) Transcript_17795:88-654(+)